eukprot:TRINITY_DN18571_c0_g1_i4.p1 TRINITY_DN18571_c0_g1~~TRINITY_DN18571_c0_g1_i4.p1  ORF type:complete len:213 (-),score=21.16 TRINITY_DN18571_c0_g1_i4:432-1070(-)
MHFGETEAERRAFFENAKEQAERDYRRNQRDAGALTRWGGALLELANFMPGEDATTMVNTAVQKFEAALEIEPTKHDALWCLGNAYTSQGFLAPRKQDAMELFKRAKDCFSTALEQAPENNIYQKGLEMTQKAPELYDEIQKQLNQSTTRASAPKTESTFWWNFLGYATVICGVLGVNLCIQMMSPAAGNPAPATKSQSWRFNTHNLLFIAV